MRKLLAILAGGILITLLAACNLSDMFKGKSASQQTTENPPPPPPAADNQVPPPPPPADNPPVSNQGYQGGNPTGQYASSNRAPQGNYPQSSGYANQGTNQSSYIPPPPQYSTSQIDQMVAPIALYPDALMTQVLMAAAYPYDVADADQWLQSNRGLSGPYLDDALATSSWDPSVIALCKFPTALDRMAGDIQWTTDLGNAFIYQKNDVLSAVQRLRQEAYRSGHLRTSPQQRVVVDTQYIVIQPYTPNVYYVPYYNPTIVYGRAWNYPNYYYQSVYVPPPSPGYSFVNGFAWGAGVAFGNVLFGGCDWNHRDVYVNNTVVYNNTIYRNTDYYRHRDRYQGQGHGNWAYNAHYNSPREGFVRAPYSGRAHGSVRGLPESAMRGGRHAAYLGTTYGEGGQRRAQGQGGQNRMQGQGGGMNRHEGMGGGQGQGGKNRMQGQGQGQNRMQGQGMNKMQGQGQNKMQGQAGGMNRLEGTGGGQGQGMNKKQGQGQGMNRMQGQGQNKMQGQAGGMNRLEGTAGGQGQGMNKKQGQGQGMNKMQGQGQNKMQGQAGGMNRLEGTGGGQGQGMNKKQGQGQGMNKMQGQGQNKMQGQGQGMNKKQGQGQNKMQGQGQGMNKKQGQGQGQNKLQGQGQGGGQNNPAKHPKKNQNQGQGGGG